MNFINLVLLQELHAHLNGSLSNQTLLKLQKLKYGDEAATIKPEFYKILESENLTLAE